MKKKEKEIVKVRGQQIDLRTIPNPKVRKVLQVADGKGEASEKEQMISFNWRDWHAT